MYLLKPVEQPLKEAFLLEKDPTKLAHLSLVQQAFSKQTSIVAGVKELNRYSIQPGKTFGASAKAKQKYKVLRVLADDVVVQDLATNKIQTFQVDSLLKEWASKGLKEISLLEDIIQTVKSILGPVLGIFLTTALIAWLTEKVGK